MRANEFLTVLREVLKEGLPVRSLYVGNAGVKVTFANVRQPSAYVDLSELLAAEKGEQSKGDR